MRVQHILSVGVICAAALCPISTASATGVLLPSFARGGQDTFGEFDSPDLFTIPAVADNSYYCRGVGFSGIDFVEFDTTIDGPGASDPTLVYRGTADGTTNAESAFSFLTLATGVHSVNLLASTTGSGSSSSARAILECFNTTLFGNFNTITAANPVNFLEIKNISTVSVTARVVLRNFSGTELTRFDVTIAANERRDIAVHDLTGGANTFGSVQVAHTGPLGALVANVSKYQVSGSNLNITATEGLKERVQR